VLTGAWPAAYGLGRCLDGFAVDDGNGYVALPPDWSEQPALAEPWIETALRQCGELPPKVAKAKAAKK
jgi:hypothetical protein